MSKHKSRLDFFHVYPSHATTDLIHHVLCFGSGDCRHELDQVPTLAHKESASFLQVIILLLFIHCWFADKFRNTRLGNSWEKRNDFIIK